MDASAVVYLVVHFPLHMVFYHYPAVYLFVKILYVISRVFPIFLMFCLFLLPNYLTCSQLPHLISRLLASLFVSDVVQDLYRFCLRFSTDCVVFLI